jgi:phage terminase large subunit GpA-like protein
MTQLIAPEQRLKHKRKLALTIAKALWKTRKQPPDVWGAANRIYGPGTGVPGRRDPTLTPYNIMFGRAFTEGYRGRRYKRVILVEGAQGGKTETFLDVIGERLDNRPAPMLYVGPSKEFVTDQFEPRLTEMFGQSTSLASKVVGGLDSKKQKKTLKRIAGTRLRLAHAGSSTALKSDPAAIALVDEYDEMLKNVKGQGDPLGLVEARGDTYADFVVGVTSTPSTGLVQVEYDEHSGLEFWRVGEGEEVSSPIWKLWQGGTRHHFVWPCPHCGEYFVPRSTLLAFPAGATPAEVERTAHLVCPKCGGVIENEHKPQMNASGLFVAPGQKIVNGEVVGDPPDVNDLSIWVSGLCSPFKTFGARAAALVTAHNTGEAAKIQTATNSQFGECYIERGGDVPSWEVLKGRALPYELGTVPDAARFLTCGIDVQKNRVVYVVRAWGPKATSWLVAHGEVMGDTAQTEVWDDLEEFLRAPIGGRLIKLVFIDSGFRPGKPFQVPVNRVYEFCRRMRKFVFASKGSSNSMIRPLIQAKLEVNKDGGAEKYGLDLMRLDTDHWKSFVHERLGWETTKAGAWHTSHEASDDYFRQVVAETRVISEGKPKWLAIARDNHYLDCEAMAAAAAYLLNAQYLRGDMEDKASDESTATTEVASIASDDATPAKPKAPPQDRQARLRALAAQLNR